MLKNNFIRGLIIFILLVLLQVLIINRIAFLGYAVPLVYIYFIIKLPIGTNRNFTIFLAFLLGFIIDICYNTPGINAAATTLAAFMSRPLQSLFFVIDDFDTQIPKLSVLGWSTFIEYLLSIVLIHQIALVSLESFSIFNWELMLLRIVLSTLITFLLILSFEGFSLKKGKV